ncbi:efflux RND transporter periplasmic adaptor subunit (plasmid) [Skermanella rosea]|uniref:efflux RND transporter periplasmic adaptor subunit n=1 Tax=Skermanella rosea TaxID=1817965 RepID=UPI001933C2B3|nr:efflux RND transporter periplasmic adaptor subunit [Skermanella rosea]UEM07329.1 efflux RND transporter periplasmic adaptor subunit [Skermanella rosea]
MALAGFCAAALAACSPEEGAQQGAAPPPPVAVAVAPVARKDVTVGAGFVGRVVAAEDVDIRARVSGFLEKRLFTEGQDVRAGDLLFTIEQAPYKAQVAQARANLASAEAAAVNAAVQLQRALDLVKNKNISEAVVDQRRADDAMAKAAVLQNRAALEQAEINLGYTEIRAPLSGRIGRSSYSPGSLVGPEAGALAAIVSQDPVHVTFPVSQREILQFKRRAAETGEAANRAIVRLTLADGQAYPHPGRVDFLDVKVDPGTDTLTVRAELPNPDRLLTDGQFATVTVEREMPEQALVVPQAAVQADQAGTFVLVVGGDGKVEVRRVALGSGGNGETVVEKGLREGEMVIVEGVQKVRPGQAVDAAPVQQAAGT